MATHHLQQPLAHGRTSAIYAWEGDKVLKVFRSWFPSEDVEYEARIARTVHTTGLRVPAVGEVVEVGGRLGLEYERIEGTSLWQKMITGPWTLAKHAALLARVHAQIHATAAPTGIPDLKRKLEKRIRNATEISARARKSALEKLKHLPSGNRLCHGDFHPNNVILTEGGPVVIDWIDASMGSPAADVARTSILAMGEAATAPARALLERAALSWGHRWYLKRYFDLRPGGQVEYPGWLPLVAAARLSEGIEELAPWLSAQAEAVTGRSAD